MTTLTVPENNIRPNRMQWEADGGVRLDLLGFVSFPNNYRGALHSHPFWELIYIGSGAGYLHSGETVRQCGADEILLVKPGEKHQFRAGDTQSFDQLYVGFSFDFALPESLTQAPPKALPESPLTELIRSELRVRPGVI